MRTGELRKQRAIKASKDELVSPARVGEQEAYDDKFVASIEKAMDALRHGRTLTYEQVFGKKQRRKMGMCPSGWSVGSLGAITLRPYIGNMSYRGWE